MVIIKGKIVRLEEKEILEDEDIMEQIRVSEDNIKKGKIKELVYR